MRDVGCLEPRRLQPLRPVSAAIQVEQRKPEDIGRLSQAATRQQFRTAYGKKLLCTQPDTFQSRPIPLAVADGQVDVLSGEVDVMQGRRNAQVDARMRFGEVAEAVYQPLRGEIG